MTAGSVSSSSALCTLTVAQSTLDQDLLLQLVLKLASPLQVKVKTAKSAPLQLQLGPHAHDNLLSQRNAILRALCGMGLHCAVDHKYQLLGGHGATSRCAQLSRMALASISEWMSVADDLRATTSTIKEEEDTTAAILARLESHLSSHAFLIPSPRATLADLDVAIAILKKNPPVYDSHPNVARWLRQCYAELQAHDSKLASALSPPPFPAPVLPIFYNGTETLPAKSVTPKTTTASSAPSTKEQQKPKPEQNQQQQSKKEEKKEQQPKKDKKEQQAKTKQSQQQQQEPAEYNISALDIRVGKIVQVWNHETAEKLFCEVIDLGTEQRKIASGLRPFYQLQDLQDRHVLVLCNLKARNLVGFPSHGMVLCASNADHTSVEFVVPPPGSSLGERVVFEGFQEGEPEPENKVAKKKIFEALAPDLQTDAEGRVVWKGAVAKTAAGEVRALNGMPNAHVS